MDSEASVTGISGRTVRVEDFETPPNRPEMVTAVETDTGKVVIAKVALLAPAATVTDDGTVAAEGLPLDSDTTAPLRAGPESVTVPVDPFPPTTVEGLRESEDRTRGTTDRLVDLVTPPYKEKMLTAVETDTGKVVIAKVALLAPAATVTAEGTIATSVLSLDSEMTAPPLGAGPESVTVPVEPLPPTTVEGLAERETSTGRTSKPATFELPPPGAGL
jgi:hypothetical protein